VSLFLISDDGALAITQTCTFVDGTTGKLLKVVAIDHNDESGKAVLYLAPRDALVESVDSTTWRVKS
jgi:hypothetical protein